MWGPQIADDRTQLHIVSKLEKGVETMLEQCIVPTASLLVPLGEERHYREGNYIFCGN